MPKVICLGHRQPELVEQFQVDKKTVQKCTIKLTSSPVTITTTGGSVKAVLSRGKIVYATGSVMVMLNSMLLLSVRR